jgi:mannose-6-phosphate isomerase-like protein (cupin superfamily)
VAKAVAPGFGGINLEDVAAPACFEVEERLRRELDIPVFHDDQHGTAVVVLAALENACRVVGKRLEDLRVVVLGAGAAGIACAGLLLHAGVPDLVAVDPGGILHPGRAGELDPQRRELMERSNPGGLAGGLEVALAGVDVFVGVSGPGALPPALAATMAPEAIVFAPANPVPEIVPDEVPPNVAVVATGRSDFPNQINNVLVFPRVLPGPAGRPGPQRHRRHEGGRRPRPGLAGRRAGAGRRLRDPVGVRPPGRPGGVAGGPGDGRAGRAVPPGRLRLAYRHHRPGRGATVTEPLDIDIVQLARSNDAFRREIATGRHSQIVAMTIPPGGEIGEEVHEENDQLLVFVDGQADAVLDDRTSKVTPNDLVLVPAGTRHNFINTGDGPLRLVTVYAPPEHPPGTVHQTKEEADAAEHH